MDIYLPIFQDWLPFMKMSIPLEERAKRRNDLHTQQIGEEHTIYPVITHKGSRHDNWNKDENLISPCRAFSSLLDFSPLQFPESVSPDPASPRLLAIVGQLPRESQVTTPQIIQLLMSAAHDARGMRQRPASGLSAPADSMPHPQASNPNPARENQEHYSHNFSLSLKAKERDRGQDENEGKGRNHFGWAVVVERKISRTVDGTEEPYSVAQGEYVKSPLQRELAVPR